MKRIYLSHFMGPDTPFYGGDRSFQVEQLRSIAGGDSCNAFRWMFPNHAGTHVDLPHHFVSDGKCLNDYLPDFWVFHDVASVDISPVLPGGLINPVLLENYNIPSSIELLLLNTGFGRYRATQAYWQKSPIFRPELADYLRTRFPFLRALGFDSISVSSLTDRMTGREAHQAFLVGDRPILLIEDMNFTELSGTQSFSGVTVAPLLVAGADAAPCTVIGEVT